MFNLAFVVQGGLFQYYSLQENAKYCVIFVFETVIPIINIGAPWFQKLQKPCLCHLLIKDKKFSNLLLT